MTTRLRMAPAPSGFLHLGNVRTFLFDYLYSASHHGDLVLRIEDTDSERSTPEAEAYIIDCLRWLGIEWQEGPDVGGPFGPYRQSERAKSHRDTALAMFESGHAYECFCSNEELEQERKEQQARGQAPRYGGRCRNLSEDARQQFRNSGMSPSLRFKVPIGEEVCWDDLVYGRVSFQSDDIGDFVILRPDGTPIYNLANVSDDHFMEISVALRSQSHLSNTPRQIMMYEALGWTPPHFAHVPDVLDLQGRKMGKRYGAKGVTDYRDEGYIPDAVVNYLALLGWSPPGGEDFLSLSELREQFSFARVQKSNAAFDPDRLAWFNAQYIRRSTPERLVPLVWPFLETAGLVSESKDEPQVRRLVRILPLVQERVRTIADIPPMIDFFYRDPPGVTPDTLAVKDHEPAEVRLLVEGVLGQLQSTEEWTGEMIIEGIDRCANELSWKRGDAFMVVRIAETGRTVTPPLIESMELLGREVSNRRLSLALAVLKA